MLQDASYLIVLRFRKSSTPKSMTPKLKSSRSYRANHTDGLEEEEIRGHEYPYQSTQFDENGNVLSEETFDQDGEIEHKLSYSYDGQGRMVEEILIEEDDFVSEHRTMEYDEQGKLCREQLHYLDESFDETTFTYSDDGLLLSKRTTGSDGEAGNRIEFAYEGKFLVSEIEYDPEGDMISKKLFGFEEGKLTEESVESKDEEWRLIHEYDETGKRLSSKRYNSKGQLVERSTFSYDEAGHATGISEETVSGTEQVRMEYDEKGNLLVQESLNQEEEVLSRIDRTYDEHNQVLTTHVFVDGRGQRAMQDYRIRFDYEFYTE